MEVDWTTLKSSITTLIPTNSVFKIFGYQYFSFEQAFAHSPQNWSGFYSQHSAEHSMRYLTKKWGDGAEKAVLLKLIPKIDLKVFKVDHKELGNFKVSGDQKAEAIKKHLKQHYSDSIGAKLTEQSKLVYYLGQQGYLLECMDQEQKEIIIPHNLLNNNFFDFQQIMRFTRSNDGMLRTLFYQFCSQQEKVKVMGDLQFQPYLILKMPQVSLKFNDLH